MVGGPVSFPGIPSLSASEKTIEPKRKKPKPEKISVARERQQRRGEGGKRGGCGWWAACPT